MIASIAALSLLTLSARASLSCYEPDPGTEQKTVALEDCFSVLEILLAGNNFSDPITFSTSTKGGSGVPYSWHSSTCKIGVDLTNGYAEGKISRYDVAKTAVTIIRACTIPDGEANVGGQATAGVFSEFLVSFGAFTPKHYKGFDNSGGLGPHGIKRSQTKRTVRHNNYPGLEGKGILSPSEITKAIQSS